MRKETIGALVACSHEQDQVESMGRELRPRLLDPLCLEKTPSDLPPRSLYAISPISPSPKGLLILADPIFKTLNDVATMQDLGIQTVDGRALEEASLRRRLCDAEDVREGVEFLDEVLIVVGGAPARAESFGDAQSEIRGRDNVAERTKGECEDHLGILVGLDGPASRAWG